MPRQGKTLGENSAGLPYTGSPRPIGAARDGGGAAVCTVLPWLSPC